MSTFQGSLLFGFVTEQGQTRLTTPLQRPIHHVKSLTA